MVYDFLSWKLNESLSSARERFLKSGTVDQETFDQLKTLDPTPTFKYLEKIIGFYLNDKASLEELEQVVSRFHTLLGKNQVKTRDINAFKSFSDLKSETQSSETQYVAKQETKARAKDYDLVHEDEEWIVVIPRSHEASCKYGAGTKWCTSAEDAEHYKSYTRRGITLYYIISKRLPMENKFYKMAVAVGPNGDKECFNSIDKPMAFKNILQKSGLSASLFVSNPTPLTPYEKLGLNESKITENPDGSIDYDGDVAIIRLDLDRIPVNFRRITGSFWCQESNLTSLEGAPKEIGGFFICDYNNLTSLEGAPNRVGGNFKCNNNKLTSLEGAPKEIGEGFFCDYNNLTSLEGAPNRVEGDFHCSGNRLTSLVGAPKEVGGDFICENNELTSLEGAPNRVGGYFYCKYNNLPESEKEWARKNIKAKTFVF